MEIKDINAIRDTIMVRVVTDFHSNTTHTLTRQHMDMLTDAPTGAMVPDSCEYLTPNGWYILHGCFHFGGAIKVDADCDPPQFFREIDGVKYYPLCNRPYDFGFFQFDNDVLISSRSADAKRD